MNRQRLQELLEQFPSRRIAVIGDFFLDKYLDTDPTLDEKSIETGKNANQVVAIRTSPGAAGTIVNNLAALGTGQIYALGAIGNDGEAFDLIKCLRELNVSTDGLLRSELLMTPTYLKPRDVTDSTLAGEHERYDTKNPTPTPDAIVESVIESLDAILGDIDAVIVADQVARENCGVITDRLRSVLAERALQYADTVFWADSRKYIHSFRNLMIKPNQFEAVRRFNPLPQESIALEEIKSSLPRLRERTGAPVFVTLGKHGMVVSDPEMTVVPGVRLEGLLDTTGAGDSATAGAVAALASNATFPEAALVGNLVASITIQQLATTGTASPQQVMNRLEVWRQQNQD